MKIVRSHALDGRGSFVVGSGSVPWPVETSNTDHQQFLTLHVEAKKLQSIRDRDRYKDVMAELCDVSFGMVLVFETWHKTTEAILAVPSGCRLSLAGGSGHQRVGMAGSIPSSMICDHFPSMFAQFGFAC